MCIFCALKTGNSHSDNFDVISDIFHNDNLWCHNDDKIDTMTTLGFWCGI